MGGGKKRNVTKHIKERSNSILISLPEIMLRPASTDHWIYYQIWETHMSLAFFPDKDLYSFLYR